MKHCCDCIYWNGEPVGFWESSSTSGLIKARLRCTHPKHFGCPKRNIRKACKYFEQKEIKSAIMFGNAFEIYASNV